MRVTVAAQRQELGLGAKDVAPPTCMNFRRLLTHEPLHHYQASDTPGVLWTCTECLADIRMTT